MDQSNKTETISQKIFYINYLWSDEFSKKNSVIFSMKYQSESLKLGKTSKEVLNLLTHLFSSIPWRTCKIRGCVSKVSCETSYRIRSISVRRLLHPILDGALTLPLRLKTNTVTSWNGGLFVYQLSANISIVSIIYIF